MTTIVVVVRHPEMLRVGAPTIADQPGAGAPGGDPVVVPADDGDRVVGLARAGGASLVGRGGVPMAAGAGPDAGVNRPASRNGAVSEDCVLDVTGAVQPVDVADVIRRRRTRCAGNRAGSGRIGVRIGPRQKRTAGAAGITPIRRLGVEQRSVAAGEVGRGQHVTAAAVQRIDATAIPAVPG